MFPFPERLAGVIFDCDGVLIDSRAANAAYYNRIRMLAGFGPMNSEEEEYTHMHSSRESLLRIFPPDLHERLRELAGRVDYEREIMPLIRPEPDLHACLSALAARGLRLAVLTNRNGMRMVLDTFDLRPYFDPVVTAAHVKPKPSPEGLELIAEIWGCSSRDLLFVGDSLLDALAAEAAGVCFAAYRNPKLRAPVHFGSLAHLGGVRTAEISLEKQSGSVEI
jgi:HAD superfamily hydrolase (TIGR01509 family)